MIRHPPRPTRFPSTTPFLSFADGTLTVTAKALTIKANNASKTYGQDNPAFSVSYTGLIAADANADGTPKTGVVTGTLTFSTSATATSGVGPYSITPSGLTAANYDIPFADGTLTVT